MSASANRPESAMSLERKILAKVRRAGRGSVWCAPLFLDLASRNAIDQCLRRLHAKSVLRRIAHGLYLYPEKQAIVGVLPVNIPALIAAISAAIASPLVPSGAYAGYLLGYEPQLPTTIELISYKTTRSIVVDTVTVQVRPAAPRYLQGAGRLIAIVVQAWRYYGEARVAAEYCDVLIRTIPVHSRRQLLHDIALAPAWMHPYLRRLSMA